MDDPMPPYVLQLEAALVETARLLTLEQLQGVSEQTIRCLADMGLLGDEQRVPHVHKWEPRGGTLSGTMYVCACGEQKWDSSRPGVGGC